MPAMAIVPVIESLLLSSREPPMAISVLDNTIATDLDTAASISTGKCVSLNFVDKFITCTDRQMLDFDGKLYINQV